MKKFLLGTCCVFAHTAGAADLSIVTDTPPVHSLVSQVMKGVGTPELILSQPGSPHDYNLRPSEARRLSNADLVVWTGHALSPWLEGPIETLAETATVLELLEVPATNLLEIRGDGVAHIHKYADHGPAVSTFTQIW